MNKRTYLTFLSIGSLLFFCAASLNGLPTFAWQKKWEERQRQKVQPREETSIQPTHAPQEPQKLETIIQQSTILSMLSSNSAYHELLKKRLLELSPDGSLKIINVSDLESAIITEQNRIAHEKMSWYQKTALAQWIRNHPNSTELIKIVVYASIGGYITYHAQKILAYCGIPLSEIIPPTHMTTTGTQSAPATPISVPSMIERSCQTDSDDGFVHVDRV